MLDFHVYQIFRGFEFCLTNIGSHAAWQKYSNFSGAQTEFVYSALRKVTTMVSELLLHYIQISVIWWEGHLECSGSVVHPSGHMSTSILSRLSALCFKYNI